jgi:hypothetical protein
MNVDYQLIALLLVLWTQPGDKSVYPDPWKRLCLMLKVVVVVYV